MLVERVEAHTPLPASGAPERPPGSIPAALRRAGRRRVHAVVSAIHRCRLGVERRARRVGSPRALLEGVRDFTREGCVVASGVLVVTGDLIDKGQQGSK